MRRESTPIDTRAIRQAINLVEFAQHYTQLKQISRQGEFAGPCPCCGGEDRFHVKGDRFYCRQCYPRGGDVIDLVRRVEGVSFRSACQRLLGDALSFSERPRPTRWPKPDQEPARPLWQEKAFQRSAHKTMAATYRLLLSEAGAEGQSYLQARGLTEATWRTYRLGFGHTFHPVRHANHAALFIPWFDPAGDALSAIQHRFLGATLPKGERYSLKPGSEPLVFGLPALMPAPTVVVVEGEFNAMSLHQCGVQAVSVGSEANRSHPQTLALLSEQLAPYAQVQIWLDQAAYGAQFCARLRQSWLGDPVFRVIDSQGPDANDLLLSGDLPSFLDNLAIHPQNT
jgi:DNA primase